MYKRQQRDQSLESSRSVYRGIYKDLAQTVRDRVRENPRTMSTAVEIPAWIPGRQPFDLTHAVAYVQRKFEMGGFKVYQGPRPSVLILDWSGDDEAAKKRREKKKDVKAITFTSKDAVVTKALRDAEEIKSKYNI